MHTKSIALLTLALVCLPHAAHAQVGVTGGIRVLSSADAAVKDSERKGYEGQVFYDFRVTPRVGVRPTLTLLQMQFQRDGDSSRFQVAENGIELSVAGRYEMNDGAFAGTYGLLAPIASFRGFCGTSGFNDSNGRVPCDEGETFRMGYMLGAGFRWPGESLDFLFELRYSGNTVAAVGGSLVTISFGLQRQRRLRDLEGNNF